jgi:hypothetical protein
VDNIRESLGGRGASRTTYFVGVVPELLNRPTLPGPAEVSSWVKSGLDLLSIEVGFVSSTEFFTNG